MGRKYTNNITITIDKDVPIPTKPQYRSPYQEAIAQMAEGDSAFFPHVAQATNLQSQLKKAGFNSASRKVEGGVRVWKLSPLEIQRDLATPEIPQVAYVNGN